MSETIFTDAFDAVWNALDGDERVSALMKSGTRYRWTGGLLKRFAIELSNCPILFLGPSGDIALPMDHREGEPTLPLMGLIAVGQQDCRVGLDLLTAVVRALRSNAPFGLGNDGLHRVAWSQARMDLYKDKEDAEPLWTATFTVTLYWRKGTEI